MNKEKLEPKTEYGLNHYAINCPLCDFHTDSDKGMKCLEDEWVAHIVKEHPRYIASESY